MNAYTHTTHVYYLEAFFPLAFANDHLLTYIIVDVMRACVSTRARTRHLLVFPETGFPPFPGI